MHQPDSLNNQHRHTHTLKTHTNTIMLHSPTYTYIHQSHPYHTYLPKNQHLIHIHQLHTLMHKHITQTTYTQINPQIQTLNLWSHRIPYMNPDINVLTAHTHTNISAR